MRREEHHSLIVQKNKQLIYAIAAVVAGQICLNRSLNKSFCNLARAQDRDPCWKRILVLTELTKGNIKQAMHLYKEQIKREIHSLSWTN